MDEISEKLLQNGFAIAVASFLLLRTDKRIENLTEAVHRLSGVLTSMLESGRKK